MSSHPEWLDLSVEKLIQAWRRGPPPDEDGEPGDPIFYYPELAVWLAESGDRGLAFIESALADEDPFRAWAAIIGVGRSPDTDRSGPRIATFLGDPRPLVARGAIEYMTGHKLPQYLDTVAALTSHPEREVSTAALEYLAMVHPDVAGRWLRPALEHPDPQVRAQACDGFELLGDPSNIAFIEPLLRDRDADVRAKAAEVIRFLRTGEFSSGATHAGEGDDEDEDTGNSRG